MSDLSKHLPLSNHPRADESTVTSDRRAAIAALVDEARRLVAGAAADDEGRLSAVFLEDARLLPEAGPSLDPLVRLAEAAATVRSGRRRGIRPLVQVTRALLRLAATLGKTAAVDPQICGAIALWGATSGPFERRVVLTGHTVRATDADWQFGNGPLLEGTALEIAAFVLGVSDVPPRPLSSPR